MKKSNLNLKHDDVMQKSKGCEILACRKIKRLTREVEYILNLVRGFELIIFLFCRQMFLKGQNVWKWLFPL